MLHQIYLHLLILSLKYLCLESFQFINLLSIQSSTKRKSIDCSNDKYKNKEVVSKSDVYEINGDYYIQRHHYNTTQYLKISTRPRRRIKSSSKSLSIEISQPSVLPTSLLSSHHHILSAEGIFGIYKLEKGNYDDDGSNNSCGYYLAMIKSSSPVLHLNDISNNHDVIREVDEVRLIKLSALSLLPSFSPTNTPSDGSSNIVFNNSYKSSSSSSSSISSSSNIATGSAKTRDSSVEDKLLKLLQETFKRHTFYYSLNLTEYDFTRSLQSNQLSKIMANTTSTITTTNIPTSSSAVAISLSSWRDCDDRFFWNLNALDSLITNQVDDCWIVPVTNCWVTSDVVCHTNSSNNSSSSINARQNSSSIKSSKNKSSISLNTTNKKQFSSQKLSKRQVIGSSGSSSNMNCNNHHSNYTLTLISRRSRYRQGPRYIKRGVDCDGHVANMVETEQILVCTEDSDNDIGGGRLKKVKVSAFVQTRGSIPLFWEQPDTWLMRPGVRMAKNVVLNAFALKQHIAELAKHFMHIKDKHVFHNTSNTNTTTAASSRSRSRSSMGKLVHHHRHHNITSSSLYSSARVGSLFVSPPASLTIINLIDKNGFQGELGRWFAYCLDYAYNSNNSNSNLGGGNNSSRDNNRGIQSPVTSISYDDNDDFSRNSFIEDMTPVNQQPSTSSSVSMNFEETILKDESYTQLRRRIRQQQLYIEELKTKGGLNSMITSSSSSSLLQPQLAHSFDDDCTTATANNDTNTASFTYMKDHHEHVYINLLTTQECSDDISDIFLCQYNQSLSDRLKTTIMDVDVALPPPSTTTTLTTTSSNNDSNYDSDIGDNNEDQTNDTMKLKLIWFDYHKKCSRGNVGAIREIKQHLKHIFSDSNDNNSRKRRGRSRSKGGKSSSSTSSIASAAEGEVAAAGGAGGAIFVKTETFMASSPPPPLSSSSSSFVSPFSSFLSRVKRKSNIKTKSSISASPVVMPAVVQQWQEHLIRTNCMDCLDRTNVVQTALARWALSLQFKALGGIRDDVLHDHHPTATTTTTTTTIDPVSRTKDKSSSSNSRSRRSRARSKSGSFSAVTGVTTDCFKDQYLEESFRRMWGDNGDNISLLYAGTCALKRDVTRHGRRTRRGALDDGLNSAIRYYINNYQDADRQTGVDVLLGYIDADGVVPVKTIDMYRDDDNNDDNENAMKIQNSGNEGEDKKEDVDKKDGCVNHYDDDYNDKHGLFQTNKQSIDEWKSIENESALLTAAVNELSSSLPSIITDNHHYYLYNGILGINNTASITNDRNDIVVHNQSASIKGDTIPKHHNSINNSSNKDKNSKCKVYDDNKSIMNITQPPVIFNKLHNDNGNNSGDITTAVTINGNMSDHLDSILSDIKCNLEKLINMIH